MTKLTHLFIVSVFFFLVNFEYNLLASASKPQSIVNSAKKVAIVQLSFDGIKTHHCGVGTVVMQTQKVLEELNNEFSGNLQFKLHLISGDYSAELPEYSENSLKLNVESCNKSGGRVQLIPIQSNNQMFGNPAQWKELCMEGAKLCAQVINENAHTIIIAHDTAFAQLPLYLEKAALRGEIQSSYISLWVPHATSWSYNGHTESGIANWPERHQWELEAVQQASPSSFFVGYISGTIKKDLLSPPFCINNDALVPFHAGILRDRFLCSIPEEVIASELTKRQIPIDRPLIYSIGRATPLKGHDILLEAYRHLKKSHPDIHLVLQAPPSDYMPEYFHMLKSRIENEKLDVTFIDQFDPDLPTFIYQWPKSSLIALLSRVDTQPLTIMEARTNPSNSILLTSDPSRTGNQIIDGKNGFTCQLKELGDIIVQKPLPLQNSLQTIVETMEKILTLINKEERQRIIDAGKDLVAEQYDIRLNMRKNCLTLVNLKRTMPSIPVQDLSEILSADSKSFSSAYSLPSKLQFASFPGGMSNPPVQVFSGADRSSPLGIAKKITEEPYQAASKLRSLATLQSPSPIFPRIFKNIKNEIITKAGAYYYYFEEFLSPDLRAVTFSEVLNATGNLHRSIRSICNLDQVSIGKLQEYQKRSALFKDPAFEKIAPEIFSDKTWEKIKKLNEFYSSREFSDIYNKLPKQLIHGDNNQTNIVISGNNAYFVDLDSFRVDVRMLDLASYFRYGGFNQYCKSLSKNSLIEMIELNYDTLSKIEKETLNLIVVFSHIEFLSWVMENFDTSIKNQDKKEQEKSLELISLYKSQLTTLLQILKSKEKGVFTSHPFLKTLLPDI